jgi:hypothetical protein
LISNSSKTNVIGRTFLRRLLEEKEKAKIRLRAKDGEVGRTFCAGCSCFNFQHVAEPLDAAVGGPRLPRERERERERRDPGIPLVELVHPARAT